MNFLKYFSLIMILGYGIMGVLIATTLLPLPMSREKSLILGLLAVGYAVFRYTRWKKMPFNQKS